MSDTSRPATRMRVVALNTLTCVATLALLAVLAMPAKQTLDRGSEARALAAEALPRYEPAQHPHRVFGVYVDPWHVDDWARAIGAAPQATAKFESFSRRRTLDKYAAESRRQGIRRMLVSWEPWTPVPAAYGLASAVAVAAWLPQHRHRARRAGPLHRALRTQPRALPRDRLAAVRARDERLLVSVEPRRARVPVGVATDRAAVRRRGRTQRAVRVVGEREPLRAEGSCGCTRHAGTGRGAGTWTRSARR